MRRSPETLGLSACLWQVWKIEKRGIAGDISKIAESTQARLPTTQFGYWRKIKGFLED
jgi:hypothetical protein